MVVGSFGKAITANIDKRTLTLRRSRDCSS
jgi:hypothetical protein